MFKTLLKQIGEYDRDGWSGVIFFVWNPEKYRPFPYGRLGKAVGKERDAFYIGKLEQE